MYLIKGRKILTFVDRKETESFADQLQKVPSPSRNVFTHEHRMCTRIGKFKLRFYKDSVHVFRIVQRVNSTFKCVGIVREEVKEFLIFRKKSFMTRPGFVGSIIDSSSIRTRTT